MKLNEFLLQNPSLIEGVFTKLFGQYMMRYYDGTDGYSVQFSNTEETSYNDNHRKIIMISMKNVVDLLKNNVPVLAIAYHELAHTLYTKQSLKERMLRMVFHDHRATTSFDKIHSVWNVLEDERIERKLAKDYKFLAPIIEPLRARVQDDGLLMNWRCGDKTKAPQELMELADEFARKQPTIASGANIIATIIKKWYPDGAQPQPNTQQEQEDMKFLELEDMDFGDGQESAEEEEDEDDSEEQDTTEGVGDGEDGEGEDEDSEDGEDEDGEDGEGVFNVDGEEPEEKIVEINGSTKSIDPDGQDVILNMLKTMEKTIIEAQERQEYNKVVVPTKQAISDGNPYLPKIERIFPIKSAVRQGMTQAQRKAYTSNISNRISVERVIESRARKSEPKVFYGRGKDVSFLRKVVVFEDVSGSTAGYITHLFSSIAASLSSSFEQVEWWAYADNLYQKHKKDYQFETMQIADRVRGIGGSTYTHNLLTVMNKYKNQDNIYVIITDGDMSMFFRDEYKDLYEIFKDKIAVVGLLDDEIKNKIAHHYDFTDELRKVYRDKQFENYQLMAKLMYEYYNGQNNAKRVHDKLIYESTRTIVDIVNTRIK